jgi:uncharacterized iron-regulated membrane protein
MSTFKKVSRTLHLWLGLASGLVVFVVSLTGAIFVFQDEVRDVVQPWRKVEAAATPYLRPSRLQAVVERNHPDLTSTFFMLMGPDRAAVVYGTDRAGHSFATFVNPYTGREVFCLDLRRDFFSIVQNIHMYLLLPPGVGEWVVGISVLLFVVLLVTGLVLWWPTRKTDRRRSFTIKWGARWRRVNYDLHNVLGFYAASLALVLALTGLVMSFEWVNNAVYRAANLGRSFPAEKTPPAVDTLQTAASGPPLVDAFYQQMRRGSPAAQMHYVALPGAAHQPVYAIAYQQALAYHHRDEYYFHPITGQLLKMTPHAAKSRGQQLIDSNYDIHVGQIMGLGGKIVAFLVSLLCASLPVTGTLVWWGKRSKSKSQSRRHSMQPR